VERLTRILTQTRNARHHSFALHSE
jgi:hypothetical protein